MSESTNTDAGARPRSGTPVIEPAYPAGTLHNFGQLIAMAEDGALHADLSRELEQIIAAMVQQSRASGGKTSASLSLSLKFTLDNNGEIELSGDYKAVLPKARRGRSILWATRDGRRMTMRNPNQREFFRDTN